MASSQGSQCERACPGQARQGESGETRQGKEATTVRIFTFSFRVITLLMNTAREAGREAGQEPEGSQCECTAGGKHSLNDRRLNEIESQIELSFFTFCNSIAKLDIVIPQFLVVHSRDRHVVSSLFSKIKRSRPARYHGYSRVSLV